MQQGSTSQPPSPPRQNANANALIVVAVVVVALVVAATFYVYLFSGIRTGLSPSTRPTVALAVSSSTTAGVDLQVSESNPAVALTSYKVNLEVGGIFGSAGPAPYTPGTSTTLDVNGTPYKITWQNPGGSGTLSQGDHFLLEYPGGTDAPPSGTQMTFYLVWSADGAIVAQASFTVPAT